MDHFNYQGGRLTCEGVDLDTLAARVGTPAYVYSRATFEQHYDRLARAFAELDPLVCYSIKSCGNLHLLKLLTARGAGMDVVSGGELRRALDAGCDPRRIVFAGVGKTDAEVREAIAADIGYFNIESEAEFENVASIARAMHATARAALRVNPDVADPRTHAKTTTGAKETKFGVDLERAARFFDRYGRDPHLKLNAIHVHIGSPIYSPDPYVAALDRVLELVQRLAASGFRVEALDLGGGFAADYETDRSPLAADYAAAIVPRLRPFVAAGGRVILEPGRTIAANAGVLLTRVLYVKRGGTRKFLIVDAGMSTLLRPALYDAFHFIWPTQVAPDHVPPRRAETLDLPGLEPADVVGPICETGDAFARGRRLPPVARGELLAVFTAGAYGFAMASQYNAVPRPPEVLVDGDRATIIRRRETYEDLLAPEREATPV